MTVAARCKRALWEDSIFPAYAWCAIRDLLWGISVLIGFDYQPAYHWFDVINTFWFGAMFFLLGIWGIWNFAFRNYWGMTAHNIFNCVLTCYVVIGLAMNHNGACAKNIADLILMLWILLRLRYDHLRGLVCDGYYSVDKPCINC